MKRLVFVAMVLALVFTATACDPKVNQPENESKEPKVTVMISVTENSEGFVCSSNANQPETGSEEDSDGKATYVIEAGGLKLKYAEMWKDKVTVTVTEDRAAFACGETKLFDLVFNSEEGVILGTVRGEKNTVISVVDYPLEQDDPELDEMQGDVNVILQNLSRDYDFVADEAITDETTGTFDIETSVVTLKYPARWQDKVKVDVSEQGVTFTAGETKLFDLMFDDLEGGYLLGTYNDTPIYIVDYPVNTEEESRMQQDVNIIIQNLQQDSSFRLP